jgi:hypothetical protein
MALVLLITKVMALIRDNFKIIKNMELVHGLILIILILIRSSFIKINSLVWTIIISKTTFNIFNILIISSGLSF